MFKNNKLVFVGLRFSEQVLFPLLDRDIFVLIHLIEKNFL